jgi:hypothetical protein
VKVLQCEICGTEETERPLFEARFEGRTVAFCPRCLPTLIHALTPLEAKQLLRDKAAGRN